MHIRPDFSNKAVLIESSVDLDALTSDLGEQTAVAVDVESDSAYHYYEKVCLLQFTTPQADYIVDPLRIRDISVLEGFFSDPAIEKIFHAAENDLWILDQTLGFKVRGLFDTQVVAQCIGHRRLGLDRLLGQYFNVKLDKRYQRHNWSTRPLRPEHIHYARSDTHYLIGLRDILMEQAIRLDREAMVREEIKRVENKELVPREFSPNDCLKLAGASQLEPDELRVLRDLFLVRDRHARRRDVPPTRILRHPVLVEIAQRCSGSLEQLNEIESVPPAVVRKYGRELVEAVQRGLASRESPPKRRRGPPRAPMSRWADGLYQQLKEWRPVAAEEMGVAPEVVASNAVLSAVVRAAPRDLHELEQVPEVRRWQVDAFGEHWLRVLWRP